MSALLTRTLALHGVACAIIVTRGDPDGRGPDLAPYAWRVVIDGITADLGLVDGGDAEQAAIVAEGAAEMRARQYAENGGLVIW